MLVPSFVCISNTTTYINRQYTKNDKHAQNENKRSALVKNKHGDKMNV